MAHFVFAHNFDLCRPTFVFFDSIILAYRKVAQSLCTVNPPKAFYVTALRCKILIAILVVFFTAKTSLLF